MNRFLSPLFIIIGLTLAGLIYAIKTSGSKSEQLFYNDGGKGTYISLMSGPCADPFSVAFIDKNAPELKSRAKAVDSKWLMPDGALKSYDGCWVELTAEEAGEPTFIMVFSDGQTRAYTKAAFTAKRGQVGA